MKRRQVGSSVAAPEPASTDNQWLTLEQASRRLGVHVTTLRRWTDRGALDVFLTPGGHRRFRLNDLERFERERRRPRLPAVVEQRWAEHAIAHARQSFQQQRWLAAYDEADREAKRRLGRRMMGLVFQYVARSDDGEDLLTEARILGGEHARSGLRFGQPLPDLLQAVGFFRATLVEVALLEQPRSLAADPEANVRPLRRLERLMDEVQTGLVETYLSGGHIQPCA